MPLLLALSESFHGILAEGHGFSSVLHASDSSVKEFFFLCTFVSFPARLVCCSERPRVWVCVGGGGFSGIEWMPTAKRLHGAKAE